MNALLSLNLQDIVLIALVGAAFIAATVVVIVNKIKGKSSCGCGCSSCPYDCKNRKKR